MKDEGSGMGVVQFDGQLIIETWSSVLRLNIPGALKIPPVIGTAGKVEFHSRPLIREHHPIVFGSSTLPFTNLRVPIGERKTAGSIVVGGRNVLPIIQVRVVNEITVIDRVRM